MKIIHRDNAVIWFFAFWAVVIGLFIAHDAFIRAKGKAWQQGFKAGLNAERYILKPAAVDAMVSIGETMRVETRVDEEFLKNPYR